MTRARVVGVTGTAGKTTVKEVLATVLEQRGSTARNFLNRNNQIGLPQSMLAASGDEAFWVMEAGISHAGDMDQLGEILEPDIAVILNAGTGHTAGLGNNVAHYKARFLRHVAPGGVGLVSSDYPDLVRESRAVSPAPARLDYFSVGGNPAAYSAVYLGPADDDSGLDMPRGRYLLRMHDVEAEVTAPFRGKYGAENVVAVSAVASILGLTLEEIAAGLNNASLPAQRFKCIRAGSWMIIDDSYNANPLSFARMLDSAAGMAVDFARAEGGQRQLVCILGEMLELGELSAAEHVSLGRRTAAAGSRLVLWKGGHADEVHRGLLEAGFTGTFAILPENADPSEMVAREGLAAGVVLFKGSRGNHLEKCVQQFHEWCERRSSKG